MRGVDLSNWDGEITPAMIADLDAFGCGFVIVRLSLESGAKTALAQRQIAALSKYHVMGYDWVYPEEDDPNVVAALSLSSFPTVLAHWADVEQLYRVYPSALAYVSWLQQFAGAMAAAQQVLGIYTGGWYWNPRLNGTTAFASLPLWNANPDGSEDLADFPASYGGWDHQTIKQFGQDTFGGVVLDVDVADDAFIASLVVGTPAVADLEAIIQRADALIAVMTDAITSLREIKEDATV